MTKEIDLAVLTDDVQFIENVDWFNEWDSLFSYMDDAISSKSFGILLHIVKYYGRDYLYLDKIILKLFATILYNDNLQTWKPFLASINWSKFDITRIVLSYEFLSDLDKKILIELFSFLICFNVGCPIDSIIVEIKKIQDTLRRK
jgi:hypothetical protein